MSKKKQSKAKKTALKPQESIYAAQKESIWTGMRWLIPVLLLTLIVYAGMFSEEKQFTNWDDINYITEQPLIKELSAENISTLFDPETQVMLNYHPLTMISLAIDYSLGYDELSNTLSISPFAKTNIILHMLNVVLVFIFLYRLSRGKLWLSIIAATLFAVHPMHVESVAWMSARKDLLYCFFFLISCIAYLKYLDTKKYSFLLLTFILFLAACLSKAMAVPLPFVLLLTDVFYNRKVDGKALLEKVPFILFAVWIGYITIGHQQNAIGEFAAYSVGQRIMFACYGFCMYLVKLVAPVNLSALYPYPDDVQAGFQPAYYITLLVAPLLVASPIYFYFKEKSERANQLLWGTGFYILMILLVIQFVSVGQAIIADRYTYMAYIGPFFIIGAFAHKLINNNKYKNITIGVLVVFTLICSSLTYSRVEVWRNSKAIWLDVIDQYPYEFAEDGEQLTIVKRGAKSAYKNIGEWYTITKQYDSAFMYYNILAKAETQDAETWSNLGNIYTIKGELQNSVSAFDKAIMYDSTNYESYLKRGVVYSFMKNSDKAIVDLKQALSLSPGNEQITSLLAKFLIEAQRYKEAIDLLEQAVATSPNNKNYYAQLAGAYQGIGNDEKAAQYSTMAK